MAKLFGGRGWVSGAVLLSCAAGAHAEPSTLASVGRVTQPPAFIESTLPIPRAPAEPAPHGDEGLPAPSDPAGTNARELRTLVRGFPNLRATIPGATWSVHPERAWSVPGAAQCLAALTRAGVPHRAVTRELATPVPTPVEITGPVDGVTFQVLQEDRTLELSCELASRLPALAAVLRTFDVTRVTVSSSYRDHPKVSFHTFGLALDLAAFQVGKRTLWVGHDFEQTPEQRTCVAKPGTDDARVLQRIACALAESGQFSSVLTPNYNAGHRDHMHVDIRPDDPRFFVR